MQAGAASLTSKKGRQNMSWREKITFCTPTFETHEVNGKELQFYPVSYKKLIELRRIGRPLAVAISRFFSNDKSDIASTVRDFNDPQTGQRRGSEIVSESITIEVLQYREQQREMAIDGLIDAISQDANILVIGEIVMDSLRDVFPRNPSKDDITEFVFGSEERPGLDPGTIWQLCEGVLKANRKVFDPLLKRAREWAGGLGVNLAQRMKEGLQQTSVARSDSNPQANPQASPEETTAGPDSSSSTKTTNTGEN